MPVPAQRMGKRRALDTTTIIPNANLGRRFHSPAHVRAVLDKSLDLESDPDSYSDLNTKPDTDAEPDTGKDSDLGLDQESDGDLDSKAEEILKDIAQLREEGPAKPNHTPHTQKLWQREDEIWER